MIKKDGEAKIIYLKGDAMKKDTNAKTNGLIIQRLIIERRTANDERQKEINAELTKRYDLPHIYK